MRKSATAMVLPPPLPLPSMTKSSSDVTCPTMESANCLFGVTMAEAGVSQLVSVALPERDEELGEARGAGMALAASA